MAHFAKLDDNNQVVQVIVVADSDSGGGTFATESVGISFCQNHVNDSSSVWKQTSYNHNFRGHYAGIGMTYATGVRTLGVASTDVFLWAQPFPSCSVGINTADWYAPIPEPALISSEESAGKRYVWNESNYNSNPSTAWVLTD